MNSKVYHYADKADSQGGVSALCYAKPRRIDLNRASWTIRPDAVTCPKCRAKLADKAPKCAVRGVIRPGAMCGAVIVGGELCGFKGKCEHQRPLGVKEDDCGLVAPAAPMQGLAAYLRAQAGALERSYLSPKDAPHDNITTLRQWALEVDGATGVEGKTK